MPFHGPKPRLHDFVITCKRCEENIAAPVQTMPYSWIIHTCPFCDERRRYLSAEIFRGRLSGEFDTFAIITTEPNELVVEKTGHDRMPVIVERKNYQRWLERGSAERPPIDLLRPFDSERMKAWRLNRMVKS